MCSYKLLIIDFVVALDCFRFLIVILDLAYVVIIMNFLLLFRVISITFKIEISKQHGKGNSIRNRVSKKIDSNSERGSTINDDAATNIDGEQQTLRVYMIVLV